MLTLTKTTTTTIAKKFWTKMTKKFEIFFLKSFDKKDFCRGFEVSNTKLTKSTVRQFDISKIRHLDNSKFTIHNSPIYRLKIWQFGKVTNLTFWKFDNLTIGTIWQYGHFDKLHLNYYYIYIILLEQLSANREVLTVTN